VTSIQLLNKLINNQANKKIKLNSHACVSLDIESSNPETAEKTASTHRNNPTQLPNRTPKVKEQTHMQSPIYFCYCSLTRIKVSPGKPILTFNLNIYYANYQDETSTLTQEPHQKHTKKKRI